MHQRAGLIVVAIWAGLAGVAVELAAGADEPQTERVYYDALDEQGHLVGGVVEMGVPEVTIRRQQQNVRGGAGDNRVDIVFVGDGYTAGEMGQFHTDVATAVSQLFQYEPFKSYETYFQIHEVEVVSNESGVDNDPTQGISRDTALDMSFWCSGTERLLCVNVNKAYSFANQVGDVDQVIALANSSKYGGAGYTSSDLATCSGHNGSAPQIAIHELGHSLGDLADEYDYGGATTWTGGEPSAKNASIYEAAQMADESRKWHQWLGYGPDTRFDGTVGTFEGCNYSVFGIYRPSNNSMMRSLNRKFNAPSAERLIRAIYVEVDPIEDHTSNAAPIASNGTVSVTPMQPIGHSLDVTWTLDGVEIPGTSGQTTVDLSAVGIVADGVVRATVVDNTDMVRDESVRSNWLTSYVEWVVTAVGCGPADIDGDGDLDLDDVNAFAAAFIAGDLAADVNDDGILNLDDVGTFAGAFVAGCP
ncbi:MAG: M64 family metallopeptidase [Phycisphaerales bacterium]